MSGAVIGIGGLRYGELDQDVVVQGALRLARRVGIEGVTMRRLADEVGTSAAAVYYHVPNKQAALDLVTEAVLAAVEVPTRGTWDERITGLFSSGRSALHTVPGIAGFLQSRPPSAGGHRLDTASRDILHSAGFDSAAVNRAHTVLHTHLLGSVSLEHALAGTDLGTTPAGSEQFDFGMRVIVTGLKREATLR